MPDEAEPRDLDPAPVPAVGRGRRTCCSSSAPAGRWVAEYYPCEEVTDLGEGRLRVSLRTPDTQWVRRLALRLGADGRVIGPAELADRVREDAAAALAQYG